MNLSKAATKEMENRIRTQLYWFPIEEKIERMGEFLEQSRRRLVECQKELGRGWLVGYDKDVLIVKSSMIWGDASGKEGIISEDLGGWFSHHLFGLFKEDLVGWIDSELYGYISGYFGVVHPDLKGPLPQDGYGNITGVYGCFWGNRLDPLRISGAITGSFKNIGGDITGIHDCSIETDIEPILREMARDVAIRG